MRRRLKSAAVSQEVRPEAVPESPELSRDHTVVTLGGTKDQDSQSTRGDYAAPRQEAGNDRTKHFTSKLKAIFIIYMYLNYHKICIFFTVLQ